MIFSAMKTAILNYIQPLLSSALTLAGLDDFEDYLDYIPDDAEKRQLGIYLAEGSNSKIRTENFLIQAQLPKELDPTQYLEVLYSVIESIKPSVIDFHDFDFNYITFYPDESNSKSGVFILFELQFNFYKDSCY